MADIAVAVGAESLAVHDFRPWLGDLRAYVAVELYLTNITAQWVDVTRDLLSSSGALAGKFGIDGNGPTDRLASVGVLTFGLNNSASNSAGLAGYYSPAHANCLRGFQHGVLVRVTFTYGGLEWPRFYGRIAAIDPAPGVSGQRQTRVTVHDKMADLVDTELRNVTLQTSKTESALIATLVSALPAAARPVSLVLDSGVDTAPYAFDKLQAGQNVAQPLAGLANSSLGYVWMRPDGKLRYENRHARPSTVSTMAFADDMVDFVVPTTLDGVFNRVRVTFHPKTVDANVSDIAFLWAQTGAAPVLAPGETIAIWGDYYKAAEPSVAIGGTAQVAPVATTDYLGNTQADGLGTDKTANLTVTADAFSSTVKFTVTNDLAGTVYLTKLQIRGKGVYDKAPQTYESSSVQSYGDRAVNIDMPFQSDGNVAQDLADYLLAQYQGITTQTTAVTFSANRSDTFMRYALGASIGDRLTISETQTGLLLVDTYVNSISWTAQPGENGLVLFCTFGLSTAVFLQQAWIMDDPVYSLAGTSTYFGFA